MPAAVAQEAKRSTMERAIIAKFGAYFEERGLGPADIPAAIIVHELLGALMASAAWALCYKAQPSRALGARVAGLVGAGAAQTRLHAAYSGAMAQATSTVRRMSWLRAASGVDPARLTTSLAESIMLRAAAKPGTFVFKLWASYHLVRLGKQRGRGAVAKGRRGRGARTPGPVL